MSGFHRFLRAITRHYRLPFGDAWFNDRIDRFFRNREPQWLLAPAAGAWPTMELDLTQKLQRKFFYFPKLHGWYYGRLPFRAFLTERLTPGSTFLDIGSNVGFFSLLAARLVGPTGRVYSFEPDPDTCEALRRSAQANGYTHLRTHQLALSDEVGELTFYRAKDGTANSLVPEAQGREARYERTLKTPVTTLDKLVADGTIDPRGIKAIKVDVEGAEPRTVAGMLEALRAADYPAIWCEVRGPRGSTRAPNTFVPVRDTLATIGYRPYIWKAGERRPVVDADVVKRTDVLFERD
ncbi:MAG: FkbM family methyltransferase [Deltaproteobacteria bacterium]|nr:FkbM family methyltransferase [Deltaproteobacteria bacterium]